MKVFYLNFILLVCLASACEPCRYVDCAVGDNAQSIRFASKADSIDLIIGGRYSLEALNITPLLVNTGGPSPFFSKNSSTLPATPGYSVIINANANTRGYVFQLGQLPADTLFCLTSTEDSKCCGTITNLEGFVLNGDTLPFNPSGRGFYIYK